MMGPLLDHSGLPSSIRLRFLREGGISALHGRDLEDSFSFFLLGYLLRLPEGLHLLFNSRKKNSLGGVVNALWVYGTVKPALSEEDAASFISPLI